MPDRKYDFDAQPQSQPGDYASVPRPTALATTTPSRLCRVHKVDGTCPYCLAEPRAAELRAQGHFLCIHDRLEGDHCPFCNHVVARPPGEVQDAPRGG